MEVSQLRCLNALVVVAHCDDESLFCSGLIRQLVFQECSVWIQPVTSIADCNPIPDDPAAESLRQQKRAKAFVDACRIMGAWPLPNFNLPNTREYDNPLNVAPSLYGFLTQLVFRFDMAITHGLGGEAGHAQHIIVAEEMMRVALRYNANMLTFSATGPIVVPVDMDEKRRVLACYRYGTTRTDEWHPTIESNPELAPWLGSEERFDYFPASK